MRTPEDRKLAKTSMVGHEKWSTIGVKGNNHQPNSNQDSRLFLNNCVKPKQGTKAGDFLSEEITKVWLQTAGRKQHKPMAAR